MPTISTLISAAIIVAVLILLVKALIYFHHKQKRIAAREFLDQYRQVLKYNNLSFSAPEMLKDAVIGMDEIHRELLILKLVDNKYDSQLIDLDLGKNCTIRKSNHKIFVNGYERNTSAGLVEQISLELEFLNGKENVEVTFYKHIENDISEMQALEDKAKKWESMISNALRSKLRRIA